MAWVLKANRADSLGANGGTGSSFDSSGGDFLAVAISYGLGGSPVVTDSKSNTWYPLTAQGIGGSDASQLVYAYNAIVGTNHTIIVSGSSIFAAYAVQAWSGSQTSPDPYDVENGAFTAGGTTLQTGSVNTATDELVVTGLSGIGSTFSIDSGFTKTDEVALVGGTSYGVAMAYKVQTGSSENPTWTSDAAFNSATIATFKIGSGSAPVTIIHRLSSMGVGG